MQVSFVEREEFKAIVLQIPRNGHEVRRAWKELQGLLVDHPSKSNIGLGYVLVPEWQWATGVEELWVGVEVDSYTSIPQGVQTLTIPAKKFAKITVRGNREQMDKSYASLNQWFKDEGYVRDVCEGSFSLEANRLQPVNPFGIPADQIAHFEFDIYAPIV